MPTTQLLNTQTDLIYGNAGDISIFTYYNTPGLPNTLYAFISNEVGQLDQSSYIENELLIKMKNNPQDIDFEIDNDGNLIVFASDSANYEIDSNGDLIYQS